jgi:hypothetical protein
MPRFKTSRTGKAPRPPVKKSVPDCYVCGDRGRVSAAFINSYCGLREAQNVEVPCPRCRKVDLESVQTQETMAI